MVVAVLLMPSFGSSWASSISVTLSPGGLAEHISRIEDERPSAVVLDGYCDVRDLRLLAERLPDSVDTLDMKALQIKRYEYPFSSSVDRGVYADGTRLHYRDLFVAEVRRTPYDAVFGHHEIWLGAPGSLKSLHSEVLAYIGTPVAAGTAFAANKLRTRCRLVTGSDCRDILAHGNNLSSVFMPLDNGICYKRMLTVHHMYVRTAYTDLVYSEKNFVVFKVFRFRSRNFEKLYVVWFYYSCLNHFVRSVWVLYLFVLSFNSFLTSFQL
mgnify:CR=1 FL=1